MTSCERLMVDDSSVLIHYYHCSEFQVFSLATKCVGNDTVLYAFCLFNSKSTPFSSEVSRDLLTKRMATPFVVKASGSRSEILIAVFSNLLERQMPQWAKRIIGWNLAVQKDRLSRKRDKVNLGTCSTSVRL